MDAATQALFLATPKRGGRSAARGDAQGDRGARRQVGVPEVPGGLGGRLSRDAILAAIATTIAWGPLMRKRITRLTAETLPWYLRLYGVMVGATIPGEHHQPGSLRGIPRDERFGQWTMADLCFLAMTGKKPTPEEALPLQILVGLLISNGPGSISAQGAKGAVSADGPQTPGRVQINKAMVGFLTHTGYSHGGNGFEGMAFLLDQFKDKGLKDPTDPAHGIDLKAMATDVRASLPAREEGVEGGRAPSCAPCRACITRSSRASRSTTTRASASSPSTWRERGRYNVFHAFYRELVQALYEQGATPYVFCVNVDAVIAALLLALLWPDYQAGRLTERDLETAAFTVFLYGRMIGCGGGDRRPPEPRPQHGHPHAGLGLRVRGLMDGAATPAAGASRSIRTIAMPADTNPAGDIFGGWLMSQMDLAAGNLAALTARGRAATVAVDGMRFHLPVKVGDEVSLFASLTRRGRTSMHIHVTAWRRSREREDEREGHLRHLRLRRPRRRRTAAACPGTEPAILYTAQQHLIKHTVMRPSK